MQTQSNMYTCKTPKIALDHDSNTQHVPEVVLCSKNNLGKYYTGLVLNVDALWGSLLPGYRIYYVLLLVYT